MANVYYVEEKPKHNLKKIEYVVEETPSFIDEVNENKKYNSSSSKNLTNSYLLRGILQSIATKYNPYFNVLADVPISRYLGLPFKNDEELDKIVVKIVQNHSRDTILGYIKHKVGQRPKGTRVVYFVSDSDLKNDVRQLFITMGLPEMDEDNLYEELKFKTGKVTTIGNTDLKTNRRKRSYEELSAEPIEETDSTIKTVKKESFGLNPAEYCYFSKNSGKKWVDLSIHQLRWCLRKLKNEETTEDSQKAMETIEKLINKKK
jgi:hypothetical protein